MSGDSWNAALPPETFDTGVRGVERGEPDAGWTGAAAAFPTSGADELHDADRCSLRATAAASAEAARVWCRRAEAGEMGTAMVEVVESSMVFLRMVSRRSGRSRWNLGWLNSQIWDSGAPRMPLAVLLSFEKPGLGDERKQRGSVGNPQSSCL